jgi:hypothetical protein
MYYFYNDILLDIKNKKKIKKNDYSKILSNIINKKKNYKKTIKNILIITYQNIKNKTYKQCINILEKIFKCTIFSIHFVNGKSFSIGEYKSFYDIYKKYDLIINTIGYEDITKYVTNILSNNKLKLNINNNEYFIPTAYIIDNNINRKKIKEINMDVNNLFLFYSQINSVIYPSINTIILNQTKYYNVIFDKKYKYFRLPKSKSVVLYNLFSDDIDKKIFDKIYKIINKLYHANIVKCIIKIGNSGESRGVTVTKTNISHSNLQKIILDLLSTLNIKYIYINTINIEPFNIDIQKDEIKLLFINNKCSLQLNKNNKKYEIYYNALQLSNKCLNTYIQKYYNNLWYVRLDIGYATHELLQDKHSILIKKKKYRFYINEVTLFPSLEPDLLKLPLVNMNNKIIKKYNEDEYYNFLAGLFKIISTYTPKHEKLMSKYKFIKIISK